MNQTEHRVRSTVEEPDTSISSPDRVVDVILRGVRTGRFVPGQRLIEADLTAALRVSRGPVREALKRLAAEGVVTLNRHRGAYISALSRTEAEDMLVVLETLGTLMARLAAHAVQRGDDAGPLKHAFERLATYRDEDGSDIASIDKRVHFYDALGEVAGNRQLARILPTMQTQLLRQQIQPYLTITDRRDQLAEYAEVTTAVLAGKSAAAEKAMRKHFQRARVRIARMPEEAFALPTSSD